MRKTIAVINLTLDGVSDHTAGIPDSELHQHYTALLNECGVILYGRTTYELMEYWREILEKPGDDSSMNSFAQAIHHIPKVVFSRTLRNCSDMWETAQVATRSLEDEVRALKKVANKDILVGSPSLIIQLLNLNLIDECQFCIHPVIAASGARLFDSVSRRTLLKLLKAKILGNGSVILYYEPVSNHSTG